MEGIFGVVSIVKLVVCGCFLWRDVICFNFFIILFLRLWFVVILWFIDKFSMVFVKYCLFDLLLMILVVLFSNFEWCFDFFNYWFNLVLVFFIDNIYIDLFFGCGWLNVLVWMEISKFVFFWWVILGCWLGEI